MTVEDVIYGKLSAVGPTYPNTMPTGATIPGMSYFFLPGGKVERHHSGLTKMRRRLQVNCWGNSYAAATTLADLVRAALDTDRDNIELITAENISDFKDAEANKYRRIVEFFVYE